MKYVALLRGINVGGKNKVSMAELKACLETLGYTEVKTYINSGNVVFASKQSDIAKIQKTVEKSIEVTFGFLVPVLIVSSRSFEEIVIKKPKDFGDEPAKYHSDVVFLLSGEPKVVIKEFQPNPAVDAVWAGDEVIYHTRICEFRTKSRLSKIIAKPVYKQMTIRNWNTVIKLHSLLKETK